MRSLIASLLVLLLAGAAIAPTTGAAPRADASGPEASASARWCDTATIRIGRHTYWPSGSNDLTCRQIIDRSRALVLRNVKPRGWRCSRFRSSNGAYYGSCGKGSSYYGFNEPH